MTNFRGVRTRLKNLVFYDPTLLYTTLSYKRTLMSVEENR